MILCDTNILIEVYRGNNGIIQQIKNIGQENIAISDITCAELYWGARNKKELQTIHKDLSNLIILPINPNISTLSVELVSRFSLSHKLSIPDSLIAATALIYDIELYTLNTKDFFFINDIKLFNTKI